jgi:hypothetical protein
MIEYDVNWWKRWKGGVGFEPTPFRTSILDERLGQLGKKTLLFHHSSHSSHSCHPLLKSLPICQISTLQTPNHFFQSKSIQKYQWCQSEPESGSTSKVKINESTPVKNQPLFYHFSDSVTQFWEFVNFPFERCRIWLLWVFPVTILDFRACVLSCFYAFMLLCSHA